jgi:hypothetical protein
MTLLLQRRERRDVLRGRRLLLLREDFRRLGTLPPALRAWLRPMATACLRLRTLRPLRPLCSFPRFISCIALFTFDLAFAPYRAMVLLSR